MGGTRIAASEPRTGRGGNRPAVAAVLAKCVTSGGERRSVSMKPMSRRTRFSIPILAAVAVAAAILLMQGASAGAAPSGATDGHLVVSQKLAKCCYIEGTRSVVRVRGPEEAVGRSPGPAHAHERLLDVDLPAGDYRLRAYQRPCDGNCGYLDPPTDGCSTGFQIYPAATTHVKVRAVPGKHCRTTVEAAPVPRD